MPSDRDPRYAHAVLPAHVLDDPDATMGPNTRKIKQAESALQQRVEFEALVSRRALLLGNVPVEH